jgi:flagellar basal body rod protein FlgG
MSVLRDVEQEIDRFRGRLLAAAGFVLLAFLLLAARLVHLQVFRHEELATQAEANRIAVVPIVPNRGLIVDRNGVVLATYSSGQSTPVGQVELSTFRNVQGLQPLGGNVWGATFESGDAVPGTPGSGNLGVLQAGVVEESNVDLTQELVAMMVAQRIYQANAQTIKTQDSVLQTLVNLR